MRGFADMKAVRPEDEGLSSLTIRKAIRRLTEEGVPMHSLLIAKNGKLVSETYWKPWDREKLHRLYSITKSFVSLGIGCLVKDGLVSLSDCIAPYFPEYLPFPVPEEISSMTIRDMLMMRTCHRRTTYKEGSSSWDYVTSYCDNWTESFFKVKPDHDPGTLFYYDTSSPHTLGALIEKLTGMELVDYLRKHFLDELGVSERTYFVKDPAGTSVGGSGLMMRPVDLLSVMQMVMDGGYGLVPADYLKEATSRLSETETGSRGLLDTDQNCGYGFQFWRMSHDSYAMLGLGGQIALAIPEKRIVAVTTADTQADRSWERLILDSLWDIAGYSDDGDEDAELEIPKLSTPVRKDIPETEYDFHGNMLGFRNLKVCASGESGEIRIQRNDDIFRFGFSFGANTLNPFPIEPMSPAYASAAWLEDGTLGILVQFSGEELGTLKLQLAFSGSNLTVKSSLHGELHLDGFTGVAAGCRVG